MGLARNLTIVSLNMAATVGAPFLAQPAFAVVQPIFDLKIQASPVSFPPGKLVKIEAEVSGSSVLTAAYPPGVRVLAVSDSATGGRKPLYEARNKTVFTKSGDKVSVVQWVFSDPNVRLRLPLLIRMPRQPGLRMDFRFEAIRWDGKSRVDIPYPIFVDTVEALERPIPLRDRGVQPTPEPTPMPTPELPIATPEPISTPVATPDPAATQTQASSAGAQVAMPPSVPIRTEIGLRFDGMRDFAPYNYTEGGVKNSTLPHTRQLTELNIKVNPTTSSDGHRLVLGALMGVGSTEEKLGVHLFPQASYGQYLFRAGMGLGWARERSELIGYVGGNLGSPKELKPTGSPYAKENSVFVELDGKTTLDVGNRDLDLSARVFTDNLKTLGGEAGLAYQLVPNYPFKVSLREQFVMFESGKVDDLPQLGIQYGETPLFGMPDLRISVMPYVGWAPWSWMGPAYGINATLRFGSITDTPTERR